MAHYWWILITSFFGTVSLQYISTGDAQAAAILHQASFDGDLTYTEQNSPTSEYSPDTNTLSDDAPISLEEADKETKRITRSQTDKDDRWVPNLIDKDETAYYMVKDNKIIRDNNVNRISPENDRETQDEVITDYYGKRDAEPVNFYKRIFNPWGGKREKQTIEHAWTWKRNADREYMPKRVRFSPWGGKRSGQIFYKSGLKGSKIIFSATVPEFTRHLTGNSKIEPGIQFVPNFGKKHPIEILSVNQAKGKFLPNLPFTRYLEHPLPALLLPNAKLSDGVWKKDGKRKMKFNAWGGKRSAPLIGPVWTSQMFKPGSIDAFLLIRSMAGLNKKMKSQGSM